MSITNSNIAILYGGWSDERAISLESGKSVFESLKSHGYNVFLFDFAKNDPHMLHDFILHNNIDMVFNLMHGVGGEDGTVQKYLEKISVSSIGSGSESSRLSFNKITTKEIWLENGLQTPKYCAISQDIFENNILDTFGDKVVLKPIESGSSVGIKILNKKDLITKKNTSPFDYLCSFMDINIDPDKYFIEEYINCPEYTAPIIKDVVYPIIKIETDREFYNYDAKYIDDDTSFIFPEFSRDIQELINNVALDAFHSLGCKNWGRVDFFMDDSYNINLIEVNSIPGMTSHSLVPMSANKAGLSYHDLIMLILNN